ncbi:rCG41160 [Rattus norvegicus]|uniref:RCG41160 n=1 Tax=Rattus norvegicus TaxID=10116 RepID=A6KIK3_RAT|nr:rCG41160 [Rattus norvegicus]
MLSTTMVGTLVRGWRNRSSPRRTELKPPTPQRQGGIRIQALLYTCLGLESI